MSLRDEGAVAYLLGRNGTTKQRLANFSGARLEIDPRADGGGTVEIIGSDDERRLARICIDITLQQRNNGKVKVDLEGLRALGEITHFDVDQSAVGFVLGAKGATLRQFEKMYRTFMFFDNDTVVEGGKKRLYILGTRENREKALKECENAVSYKLSGNGAVSSWRERDQPRYDDNYRHNDRGGGGGGNRDRYDDRRDRRRSPSRDRGGGGRYDDRDRRRSRSRSRGRY